MPCVQPHQPPFADDIYKLQIHIYGKNLGMVTMALALPQPAFKRHPSGSSFVFQIWRSSRKIPMIQVTGLIMLNCGLFFWAPRQFNLSLLFWLKLISWLSDWRIKKSQNLDDIFPFNTPINGWYNIFPWNTPSKCLVKLIKWGSQCWPTKDQRHPKINLFQRNIPIKCLVFPIKYSNKWWIC